MSRVAKRKTKDGRVLPDGVSERKDGRYLYRYVLNGKNKYMYDKDLTELKKKILQLNMDIAAGRNFDLANMTLKEWYPQYIKLYKEKNVKNTTLLNFNNYFKWYVQDYDIAKIPMKDLKRTNLVAHFTYLANEKGLAQGVRRHIVGGTNRTLISVILPPRLHSPVGDRRLLAGQPHAVVALFQRQDSCF